MGFNFPATPTIGEVFQGWSWDGEKWVGVANTNVDARYVEVAGDVMTGDLSIDKAAPYLSLNKPASGTNAILWGKTNNVQRWAIAMGNSVAESAPQSGSNFSIARYANDGSNLDNPIVISRSGGLVSFTQVPTVTSVGSLITEAPNDGYFYHRRNNAWEKFKGVIQEKLVYDATDSPLITNTEAIVGAAQNFMPLLADSKVYWEFGAYGIVSATATAGDDLRARIYGKYFDDSIYTGVVGTVLFGHVNLVSTTTAVLYPTMRSFAFDVSTFRRPSNGAIYMRLYGTTDYANCTMNVYDQWQRFWEVQA